MANYRTPAIVLLALLLAPQLYTTAGLDEGLAAAVSAGDVDAVRALLKHGADPNSHDGQMTVLMRSISTYPQDKPIEVMRLLLEHGADPNLKSEHGLAPIIFTAPLHPDSADWVACLLKYGADINGNYGGTTPLLSATQIGSIVGSVDSVKILLDLGADVNLAPAGPRNPDRNSALIVAAARGEPSIVQALLDAGAQVDSQNNNGDTAILFAAAEGHTSIVQLLLSSGADWTIKNLDGYTPKAAADLNGHTDVSKVLRKHKKAAARSRK
jgi:ankyrin repeat protein